MPDNTWRAEDRGYASPCHIWNGYIGPDGYGRLYVGRLKILAHRLIYTQTVRELPLGHAIELHHLCEQKDCVNPEHLEECSPSQHQRYHHAKLTSQTAREIREATDSQRAIASRYGISQMMVWRIKHGLAWAD